MGLSQPPLAFFLLPAINGNWRSFLEAGASLACLTFMRLFEKGILGKWIKTWDLEWLVQQKNLNYASNPVLLRTRLKFAPIINFRGAFFWINLNKKQTKNFGAEKQKLDELVNRKNLFYWLIRVFIDLSIFIKIIDIVIDLSIIKNLIDIVSN